MRMKRERERAFAATLLHDIYNHNPESTATRTHELAVHTYRRGLKGVGEEDAQFFVLHVHS